MKYDDIHSIPKLPKRFGSVRQVAYIVDDVDAAMDHWRDIGVGPFLITRNATPLKSSVYRGKKSGQIPVHIAFSYIGDMQLEIIEPLHTEPSIYTEAIERKLTGVHHYAVCVEDFAENYYYALEHGYEAVVDTGVDGLARMSYLENPNTNIVLEMIEWNDLTRPYFDALFGMWTEAKQIGADQEFDLASLTPKKAILKSLWGFVIRKMCGRIKSTMPK